MFIYDYFNQFYDVVFMVNSNKYPLTLNRLFSSTLYKNSNKEIVYADKERYTYEQFYDRVSRLSAGLEHIGVKYGDKVAVIDWDTARYMESYFAVPMMGAVLHTVNIRYPPDLIFYTMQHADDKYVIIRDEFLPLIERAKSLFDFVKGWIVYSDDKTEITTTLNPVYNYSDLVRSYGRYEYKEIDENSIATTFYTSGTTGLPKGVSFTHRDLVLQTMAVSLEAENDPIYLNNKDTLLPVVPMFHVHSWCMPYIATLNGIKFVLAGRYDPLNILKLIKKEHVTISAMVPPILYMLLKIPDAESYITENLRVIVGGGALSQGLAEMAARIGIKTIGGYGMSETAPVITLSTFVNEVLDLPEPDRSEYMRKAGLPIPLTEIKVVGSDGKEVPRDGKTMGEVIVRAPWLTSGYVNDPEKSTVLWRNGWLHTGDLAVVNSLRYIQIVDRERDAVKSGGEFIPTLVLEDFITGCPGVGEVAVIGVPDEKWGERPVAYISKTRDISKEDVKKYLLTLVESGKIAKWWIPDEFIFVTDFAKASTGKIDKKVLRENRAT